MTKNSHFNQVCHAIWESKLLRFSSHIITLYVIKNMQLYAIHLGISGVKTLKSINILLYEYIYMNYSNLKVAYLIEKIKM